MPLELPTKGDILEEYFFHSMAQKGNYIEKKLFRKLLYNSVLGLGKSTLKTSLLAHSDLHCGNVVLNDKNELVGVLDFDTMARGDRFWEFRPKLYKKPQDILLFKEIYSKQTGHVIDQKDIDNMKQFFSFAQWLRNLFQLYHTLPQNENKKRLNQQFKKILSKIKTQRKG